MFLIIFFHNTGGRQSACGLADKQRKFPLLRRVLKKGDVLSESPRTANFAEKEMEDREIRMRFIREELDKHGEWLKRELLKAIASLKLVRQGELKRSVAYGLFKEGGNDGIRLSFISYGRVVDMQKMRDRRRKAKETKDTIGEMTAARKRNRTRHKNTQWYARNMYGGMNVLVQRIMYELTEEEINRIKEDLKK